MPPLRSVLSCDHCHITDGSNSRLSDMSHFGCCTYHNRMTSVIAAGQPFCSGRKKEQHFAQERLVQLKIFLLTKRSPGSDAIPLRANPPHAVNRPSPERKAIECYFLCSCRSILLLDRFIEIGNQNISHLSGIFSHHAFQLFRVEAPPFLNFKGQVAFKADVS